MQTADEQGVRAWPSSRAATRARHVSAFHDRSAPVAAVTDARPQRAAPPTRLEPARRGRRPSRPRRRPSRCPMRMTGWNAVRMPGAARRAERELRRAVLAALRAADDEHERAARRDRADEDLRPGRRERQRAGAGVRRSSDRGTAGPSAPAVTSTPAASARRSTSPAALRTPDRRCRRAASRRRRCGPPTRKPPRASPIGGRRAAAAAPVVSASFAPLVDETITARTRGSAAGGGGGEEDERGRARRRWRASWPSGSHTGCEAAERIL